ncbi:cellulose synthase-like protein H1 [Cajanus cajan]|uniref:cellulose synthase-like protein H1 n=1 Tax=Cajanus cajan TaxID=3821 RepID=UPI00098D8E7B|nr:cellulose synthase-like protein H1 [Cajanus cajan]
MGNDKHLPLYDKIWVKHRFSRVMDSFTLLLLFLLLAYRIFSLNNCTVPQLLAFMCESWFTFLWIVIITTKWNPAYTITYVQRLLLRVPESELPAVDLFVTTADPVLEPPIITINTVLSLLALDYPSHKLACYVSDDGCSPLNFYALLEASKFAKLWVPFCKKYNIQLRAPFRYFTNTTPNNNEDTPEFIQDWLRIKEEYERLNRKIMNATHNSIPLDGDFSIFSNANPKNHPTIIKVIWENKEGLADELPHLIYISREKKPQHPHHYKAGAMNVLTRVSGVMTNAPYILNLDCDMYVHNPKIILHALCILLDTKGEKEVAFAQCIQQYYDGIKDDPFGNQLAAMFLYIGGGVSGLQGVFYSGTNCLSRRKIIYGLSPHHQIQNTKMDHAITTGKSSEMKAIFGTSKVLVESATDALEGKTLSPNNNLCNSLEAAREVASCEYDYGTAWGKQVGWIYGSTSEDVLTGLKIHNKGWRSEVCSSDRIGFMGCSPQNTLNVMGQQKRWASGLGDILLSKHSPIFGTLFGKLQFTECIAYLYITSWALRSIPEICYAALSAYCIITNSHFLPKEFGQWIPVMLLVIYNISTLVEYLKTGLSFRTWWNNQRMIRIITMNAWFFGFLSIILKRLRISDPVFEITKKDQPASNEDDNENIGRFTFNESAVFVPGTTILLIQLIALFTKLLGWQPVVRSGHGSGVGEMFCSSYLVICYWSFLKGLFLKGKYGIPLSTICKSTMLAFLFVHLCKLTIKD